MTPKLILDVNRQLAALAADFGEEHGPGVQACLRPLPSPGAVLVSTAATCDQEGVVRRRSSTATIVITVSGSTNPVIANV